MIKKVKSKRFKSGWGYQVDIQRKGLKRQRLTFETRALAQEIHDAMLGDFVRRRHGIPVESRVTFGNLKDKHLEAMRARGRDKVNCKRAETVLARFEKIVGTSMPVEQIETAHLSEYVAARYREPSKRNKNENGEGKRITPQTINRELSEIKSCLSAARLHFAPLSGYRSPEAPWQEEPADGRRQTWTDEMIAAVINELRRPARSGNRASTAQTRTAIIDMFIVALETGMRAGEVLRLRKGDVNFAARVILVTSKKGLSKARSGRTREVPMTDAVCLILKRRADAAVSNYLFPNRSGTGPMSRPQKPFQSACKRAGIEYGLYNEGGLVFNDARRTAENRMLDAGHQPRSVGDILGHSPETQAKHYARSTPASRRAAVEAAKLSGEILDDPEDKGAQKSQNSGAGKSRKAGA